MTKWSLFGEFLSFFILSLMYAYYREKNAVPSLRRRMFTWIFRLSLAAIALNVCCVYLIERARMFPLWLNYTMNTAYFILIIVVCSVIALYLFDLMMEHVNRGKFDRRVIGALAVLNLAYAAIAVTNVWTGVLFSFRADGTYVRGPWNRLGYGVMAIEILMVVIYFVRNRASISTKVVNVIRSVPIVVLVLTGFQMLYPETMFNGTIVAAATFILYTNFQLCQVEKDSLTQLGNRKTFFDDVSLKMQHRQPFQIVTVSLKRFGEVNRMFDHSAGDDLLFAVGRWFGKLPGECASYRFSSVSFAAVFPYRSEEEAGRHVKRICDRFQEKWVCRDISCKLLSCVCNLVWNGEDWTPNSLLEYLEAVADLPEYAKGGYVEFDASVVEKIKRAKQVEVLVRKSLEENRFFVAMQPFFCCIRNGFCCGEALARLNDYDGKPVPTGEFIPVAERAGLLDDISWAVLEKCCEFLQKHRELPLESLSVNLSMEQFLDPGFPEKISRILERYQIPFGKIKIEITERVIAQDLNYVKTVMCRLRSLGIGFYLDDFGTGYSNFASLIRLPFESVKLDRSLLSQLTQNEHDRRIIRHMVSFFHESGFHVVCEGIETEDQAELVTNMGTDLIQGFYYARPMDPEAFARFVENRPAETPGYGDGLSGGAEAGVSAANPCLCRN